MHARGAGLQQAVGEAARRGAEIGGDETRDGDGEMLEGGFEFQATATDVAQFRSEFEARFGGNELSGFGGLLAVDEDFAGHDQGLRLLTSVNEAAVHQCTIKSAFHRVRPVSLAGAQKPCGTGATRGEAARSVLSWIRSPICLRPWPRRSRVL